MGPFLLKTLTGTPGGPVMSKIVFPLFALLLAAPPVQAGSDERYVCVLFVNIDVQEDLRC